MIGIIGGGITGLTAAYVLQSKGLPVYLIEERDRTGGVLRSTRKDGFLVESGPQALMDKDPRIGGLIRDLRIGLERVEAAAISRNRFIVRNGRLAALPSSPKTLFTSPAFSFRGKCRLFMEPFIRPGKDDEETVAAFFERRVGREILDYAVDPFVSGIFAGNPATLSLRHAFPPLHALEREYGSLLKGQIRSRRKNRGDTPRRKAALFSFQEGLSTLPRALTRALGESVSFSSRVTELSRINGSWEVAWRTGNNEQRQRFERVLVTVPAHRIPGIRLSDTGASRLEELASLPYSPVTVLALGFERSAVEYPLAGFGFLVPGKERLPLLGVSFSSSVFPNRAPHGHVLMTAYIGGARSPELAARTQEELLPVVLPALNRLLGISRPPVFVNQIQWPKAIPQYNVGHERYASLLNSLEQTNPGMYFAGNYHGGISLGDCIASGFNAAERIAAFGVQEAV